MDSEYARRYADLYRRHWWWRARETLIVKRLEVLKPDDGWRRALDIGCGDGLFLDRLADYADSVEGVEIDPSIVSEYARGRYPIHLGPLASMPSPAASYDLITMLDVLEHLEDPVQELARCRSLLVPDGTLLITVPALRSLWTRHDTTNRHFTRYTRRSLARVLRESGFRPLDSLYFFHWLVLPKLAIRAVEGLSMAAATPLAVPSHPINRGLEIVSILEQRTLSRFRVIPGSSILAVAQPLSAGTSAAP